MYLSFLHADSPINFMKPDDMAPSLHYMTQLYVHRNLYIEEELLHFVMLPITFCLKP